MKHRIALYTGTGEKKIFCRGTRVIADDMADGIPYVETSFGKMLCLFPVALSDGKNFLVVNERKVTRRGKTKCPKCGYVTTLSPKML